jgi:hypothetical protein
MLDLVLWSFVVALTPSALGLAWGMIRGVGNFIDFGHSGTLEAASEQPGPAAFLVLAHSPIPRRRRTGSVADVLRVSDTTRSSLNPR